MTEQVGKHINKYIYIYTNLSRYGALVLRTDYGVHVFHLYYVYMLLLRLLLPYSDDLQQAEDFLRYWGGKQKRKKKK